MTWNEQNAGLVHGSVTPFILHGCWWWRSGQRIAMQHSSVLLSPFCVPSLLSPEMDFPTPCTISHRHASAVSTEGGRMFVVLPAEPHMAVGINHTAHSWKMQFLQNKSVNYLVKLRCLDPRSFGHTTLVRCFIHAMDIGWTSQLEESHILWRVASTGNNEEYQFLSHLLAFYILPSSSPEKVQTPERLMNSPRNRAFSWSRECSRF